MYPHRIRLRGPWDCVPLESQTDGPLPMPRRVTMPGRFADHGLAGFAGRVLFVRKFGYPGRIDDFERVWLTCEGLGGVADVILNDERLATSHAGSFAFEVTKLLGPHNQLQVTVAGAGETAGLWGEVALEVRCAAYLDSMQVHCRDDGSVEVSGVVAGSWHEPLEIYGLADGAQAHYQRIETTPGGTAFRFGVTPREPAVQSVRVDLINVSTIWHAWESAVHKIDG